MMKDVDAFFIEHGKKLDEYTEKTEMPMWIIPHLAKIGLGGMALEKKYGGYGFTFTEMCAISYQIAKWDASVFTFVGVHNTLCAASIQHSGNDEQKERMLKGLSNFDKVGAFALTEHNHGSDSIMLETYAKPCEGGFILNGSKRWIGNGTFADYIVVWARNMSDKKRLI